MGLRLVDDGSGSGDDRAALAEARQSVAGARARLEALADRLAELKGRLGQGGAGESAGEASGYRAPTSGSPST